MLEYVKYPGKDWDYQFRLAHALEDLPVEREHLDKLEQLSQLDDAIGGAAAGLVCRLAPDPRLPEALHVLQLAKRLQIMPQADQHGG